MKSLEELTAHCIRCGFCLESCPTFQITGQETESPRGRIYLVRSADEGKLEWQAARPHIMRCLGCLACETACPSGVEYGSILEIARARLEKDRTHVAKKMLVNGLSSRPKMRLQLLLGRLLPGRKVPGLLSRLLSGREPEAFKPLPQPAGVLSPLDEDTMPAEIGEVYLLEGCAMPILFPRVRQATRRLLRRVGYRVRETPQGCCGSLHLHSGYLDEARSKAASLLAAMPDNLPVVVDSAGCGSTMKRYEELISGSDIGSRVFDVSEFLLANGLRELLAASPGVPARVTYHDACHLVHAQRVRSQPRDLLAAIPGINLVDLPESDMCCGSAGIYNVTQPAMARELLDRKWRNIESTGASIVVTGNPGCHAWIAQAAQEHGRTVTVLHTTELLDLSFGGLSGFPELRPTMKNA